MAQPLHRFVALSLCRAVIWTFAVGVCLLIATTAFAQREVPIRGDRLSGFVLPVEPQVGPLEIKALRAHAWSVDDTQRLLLENDIEINIAGYAFRADRAAVWVNRLPSEDGLINQLAIYFEEVRAPTRRAGTGVVGRDLLVTGSTRGEVVLNVASMTPERPRRTAFLRRGEARLAAHLRKILAAPPRLARQPQIDRPPEPPPFRPEPGEPLDLERLEWPEVITLPEEEPVPWLASPTGTVRFAAQEVNIESGEEENIVTLIGPLVVEYDAGEAADDWERLVLTAERGVVFTDPGPLEDVFVGAFDATSIRGVYLEGNVIIRADDDEYVLRTPKAYYDFRMNQALMVDAVLRTYSREEGVLVYSRAKEMRQIAEDQWKAEHVTVSTSEFAKPHLAIGARRATITQRPARTAPDRTETHVDARHLTLRAGDLPFFYWPWLSGTLRETPLRAISAGHRSSDGARIETRWSLYGLLGDEPPDGVDAELKIDGFTKRGAGLGLEFRYDFADTRGLLDLYGLYDTGTDRTSSGLDVEPDDEFRGVALWEQHVDLDDEWSFQGQVSWISDPTFITTWREDDFRERREYETSGYLKYQSEHTALTVLAKYELNDFISNDYLIASRGYQVDKLPEIAYRRYGDSLFNDVVTYSTQSSYSMMRLVFNETTPNELGIREGAFAIDPNERIDDFLFDQGLRTRFVHRVDTRHELSAPFSIGAFRFAPFIVGRITGYDSSFEDFSDETEKWRGHISTGVRVSTQVHRINNNVHSRLFDLNRIRHIIEPSATVWYGYTNVTGSDLPIYDQSVEALSDGVAVRMGMRNTWQTQRGGPGQWRSVDFLTFDANVVLHTDESERFSPTPQFFEFMPELSQVGDHVHSSAIWLISDSLSITGEGTYDIDESVFARGSLGMQLRHSPVLTTHVEYRLIEVSDSELLDVGWDYRLTPKYTIRLRPQWDINEDELRAIRLHVARRFPDFDFIVSLRYDRIRDETTVGASLGAVRF